MRFDLFLFPFCIVSLLIPLFPLALSLTYFPFFPPGLTQISFILSSVSTLPSMPLSPQTPLFPQCLLSTIFSQHYSTFPSMPSPNPDSTLLPTHFYLALPPPITPPNPTSTPTSHTHPPCLISPLNGSLIPQPRP